MTDVYFHEQDIAHIALGCTYIQANRAEIYFPGTTKGSPSEKVVITRNVHPPLDELDNRWFPFWVPWDLWQNVVVPLLLGDGKGLYEQTIKQPPPDWKLLMRAWAGLLKQSLDPSLQEDITTSLEDLAQVIGEPILRAPVAFLGDLAYPEVDPELLWPEGHQKLEYPEVD